MSSNALISHFLIGLPSSGKSALAQQWIQHFPNTVWISTDTIRASLFGDETVQGRWAEVETVAIQEIKAAIGQNQSVIYDATNVRRAWRLGLMQKFAEFPCHWIAWKFGTSLETCKARNLGRDRQVPDAVMDQFHAALKQFPPEIGEGFASVLPVPLRDGAFDFMSIERAIQGLDRSMQAKKNRTSKYEFHPYSSLLEFERLMYLTATLMRFPGLGSWQYRHPDWLQEKCKEESLEFPSAEAEIAAVVTHEYGAIYGDEGAIARNLLWLKLNGFVNAPFSSAPLQVCPDSSLKTDYKTPFTHRYSEWSAFDRLMQIIRFLAHHPQLHQSQKNVTAGLLDGLRQVGVTPPQQKRGSDASLERRNPLLSSEEWRDNLRKDIEVALKPYGIMTPKPMRDGYFVGVGILSAPELLRIYYGLESQAKHLSDPVALQAYETFRDRLHYLNLEPNEMYPVRQVLNQQIVATEILPALSLGHEHNLVQLEAAIQASQTVWIRHLSQSAEFDQDTQKAAAFEVLPLQIVFHSIAWYLSYERQDNQLLEYYRLDRLTLEPNSSVHPRQTLERTRQKLLLSRVERLQAAGYGVYLGRDPVQQQSFLHSDPAVRKLMTDVLELWCDTQIFRFISEGTNRFAKLEMSPRLTAMTEQERRKIFKLKRTNDADYPHRLKAWLPIWSLRDSVDLRTWILRFGASVKVISPDFLARDIADRSRALAAVYSERHETE